MLGNFNCVNVSWVTGAGLVLHTSLKTYVGKDVAVFVQQLPDGADGTNASNPVLPGGLRVMDPGDYPPVVAKGDRYNSGPCIVASEYQQCVYSRVL